MKIDHDENDPMYVRAVAVVTDTRECRVSQIQRHLRIGYNHATRIIEAMQQAGVVGPCDSHGVREVIADRKLTEQDYKLVDAAWEKYRDRDDST